MAGDLGVGSGEREPRQLAHQTAATVATDQPSRSKPEVAGMHGDAVVVGFEARHLDAAAQVNAKLAGALGEDRLDLLLGDDAEAGRGTLDGEDGLVQLVAPHEDPGEVTDGLRALWQGATECLQHLLLCLVDLRQQAAAVERLECGQVDRSCLDGQVRLGEPFEDGHRDPAQPQLAGEHEADRTAPTNDHVVVHAVHFTRLNF
ncbi:hypothetical protein HEB94_007106 [Actinopolymorpha pittospori]|uniref:Uncharacterized protein n=1 Tax=Actinopolymorpha pittospori TaxID=648752 RepID=A0A927N4Q6_9ACTN|nr:hypothetical protein [Actinopolymorpha pittospori]MBE1610258.1 hypothetical protein [Actinopolymorpha pittospori]